jgi:hypothetical protein
VHEAVQVSRDGRWSPEYVSSGCCVFAVSACTPSSPITHLHHRVGEQLYYIGRMEACCPCPAPVSPVPARHSALAVHRNKPCGGLWAVSRLQTAAARRNTTCFVVGPIRSTAHADMRGLQETRVQHVSQPCVLCAPSAPRRMQF